MILGKIDVKTIAVPVDEPKTPVLERLAINPIKRPGLCFVLGCDDPCVRDEDGSARVYNHKRFGRVHSCSGHNPTGRDRF